QWRVGVFHAVRHSPSSSVVPLIGHDSGTGGISTGQQDRMPHTCLCRRVLVICVDEVHSLSVEKMESTRLIGAETFEIIASHLIDDNHDDQFRMLSLEGKKECKQNRQYENTELFPHLWPFSDCD